MIMSSSIVLSCGDDDGDKEPNTIVPPPNPRGDDDDDEDLPSYLYCPDDRHPHLIDLGLPSGTKWSCCNVDANNPEDYGGYYAWGETEVKDVYNWSTYVHCDGSDDTCHDLGSDISGTVYDVAHVRWGGSWVMPTATQFQELIDNCSEMKDVFINHERCCQLTFANGGYIIFPHAGHFWNNIKMSDNSNYWSSTRFPSDPDAVYRLFLKYAQATVDYTYTRCYGRTVRPVYGMFY